MYLIGLTGGIASGKSTVSAMFTQEHGIVVIDADKIAHDVVKPGTVGWKRVVKLFGDEILNGDKTINRDHLGQLVFSDPSKRKLLNKNLHGLIAFEMAKRVFLELIKGTRFVILDVPLLFEVKMALRFLSYTVVVYCDNDEERVKRILKRNPNLSETDALLRIQAQMKTRDQLDKCDFRIDNSKDLETTRKQVRLLANQFRRSTKYRWIRLGLLLLSGVFMAGVFFIAKALKS